MSLRDVYISIVSHAQEEMIIENFSHIPKQLSGFNIKLSIIDNTGADLLKQFCRQKEYFYYYDGVTRGFGANHNKCFSQINPHTKDIFIVCNPDIVIHIDQLEGLLKKFVQTPCDIYHVKTYFDKESNYVDNPDKYFPRFFNFAYSLATDKRLHYGSNIHVKHPEWISGAFMVFRPDVYRRLQGFDEDYFMYCEDMDLCYRANSMEMCILYDDEFYIEHETQMQSRTLFSQSMMWHIKSAVKFLVKNRLYQPFIIAK
ncbi:MAG: glycosyltransferase [Epsilonproteobacteria bacterium]|nr:glycosyltransferase [Campylobacterota bacterium]